MKFIKPEPKNSYNDRFAAQSIHIFSQWVFCNFQVGRLAASLPDSGHGYRVAVTCDWLQSGFVLGSLYPAWYTVIPGMSPGSVNITSAVAAAQFSCARPNISTTSKPALSWNLVTYVVKYEHIQNIQTLTQPSFYYTIALYPDSI